MKSTFQVLWAGSLFKGPCYNLTWTEFELGGAGISSSSGVVASVQPMSTLSKMSQDQAIQSSLLCSMPMTYCNITSSQAGLQRIFHRSLVEVNLSNTSSRSFPRRTAHLISVSPNTPQNSRSNHIDSPIFVRTSLPSSNRFIIRDNSSTCVKAWLGGPRLLSSGARCPRQGRYARHGWRVQEDVFLGLTKFRHYSL
jgi:hypothetical protein